MSHPSNLSIDDIVMCSVDALSEYGVTVNLLEVHARAFVLLSE